MYNTRSKGTKHRGHKQGATPNREPNKHRTGKSVIRTLVRLLTPNQEKVTPARYLLPSGARVSLPYVMCGTSDSKYTPHQGGGQC